MAKRVFISYRREDTAPAAGRVYDRLVRLLTKADVFFDVSAIGGGDEFPKKIAAAIETCDAALIFIGQRWLEKASPSADRTRICEDGDYVRAEVRAILARPILVLPVLVGGATMPRGDQLPADIRPLLDKNALPLRHESFDDDTENIVAAILGTAARERQWEKKKATPLRKFGFAIGGIAAAALALLVIAIVHDAVLDQPLSASIGEPMTILGGIAAVVLGGWIGLRRA